MLRFNVRLKFFALRKLVICGAFYQDIILCNKQKDKSYDGILL